MIFRFREDNEILQREDKADSYPASIRIIDMQRIFLNSYFMNKKQRYWNIDPQLHAYLRSLANNSVQYK